MAAPKFIGLLLTLFLLAACGSGARLPRLPTDGRILVFGDSLTFGTGAAPPQSYPAVLENLVGREVINAGAPGETAAAGLKRLPLLLDLFRPELLILCHGFDDLQSHKDYGQTADQVRAMVRLAKSRGIGVILIAVPRIRLMTTPALFYATIATETGVSFMPGVVSHILNDDALTDDRVHPNSQGYRILAEELAAMLRDAGAI